MVDVRVREHEAAHRPAELLDRGGERLPLRPHHERVDHGDAVVVDDRAGVAHARLAAGLEPHEHAVGELVQRVGWDASGHAATQYAFGMSERSRHLPRRSCLSVPGSSEKMLGKAPGLGADMVFLDLEDAVAPLEKPAARAKVVNAINTLDFGESVLCVRVNAWDTEWTYRDVIEVVEGASERLDELMLPKVETAADVIALDHLLTQIEKVTGRQSRVGIEAQIETARGLINVEEICAASDRLETIVLGPVDMSASMEMPSLAGGLNIPEYPGDYFHYAFVKILMAGRANGLQVIDGPYVKVRDPEGFREFCKRAQILGYDGKWALHPDQVTILNEIFGTSQEQFDRAVDILEAYEKATTEGDRKGAVMFGDEMIDEASRKVAVKVVSAASAPA